MENFTDLFGGDDLSGLEGLGDFGSAFGAAGNPQPGELGDNVGVGGAPPVSSNIPGAMAPGQYGQHHQQQYHPQSGVQQKSGYGPSDQFNQYRGMAPGQTPNQQYPYGSGASHPPSGYHQPGPSSDHRGMPPGARMPGAYPTPNHPMMGGQVGSGYPGSYGQQGQQQMYGRQMMAQQQGAWGGQQGNNYPQQQQQQPSNSMNPQYGQGSVGAPNGPQAGQVGQPNFRPQHSAYGPGSSGGQGSDMNLQQHRMGSQFPPGSNASGTFPPGRMPPGSVPGSQPNYPNAPQNMYGGPQNSMSRTSQMQPGMVPNQMAVSTSSASPQMSNFHHQGYPSRPGHPPSSVNQQQPFSSSMPTSDFPRHSVPTNPQNSSQQTRMPNMPPANAQQQQKHGRTHPIPHQAPNAPNQRMLSPIPPNQQQPGGQLQQQQSNINNSTQNILPPQPPGPQPTGPMYRAPYSSPQHPGSQSSISPAAGMSPRAMSPAQSSSPVPSKASNSLIGGQPGLPSHTQQGNATSSLQQLEQMVMPGSKEATQQQHLANSSQPVSQATSPMPPKPSQSPSLNKGPSTPTTTPMSPQHWPQQAQPQQQGIRPPSASKKGQRNPSGPKPPNMGNMNPQMGPNGPHGPRPVGMMDPQRMGHPGMHGGMYNSSPQSQPQTVSSGGMMPPHPGMSHQMGPGGNTHLMGGPRPVHNMNNQMMNQGYHNQMQQQSTPSQLPAGQQQSSYNPSMQQQPSNIPTNNMPLTPQQQQQPHPQQQQQQKKDVPSGQQLGHPNTSTSLQTTTLPPISQVQGSSVSTSNASLLNTSSLAQDSNSGNQSQTALAQSDSNRSEQTVIGPNSNASKLLSVPTGESVSSSPKPFEFEKSDTITNDSGIKQSIKSSDLSEPTSSNIKPEEPSSTTSPKQNESENKPDSSSALVDSSFGKASDVSEKSTCPTSANSATASETQQSVSAPGPTSNMTNSSTVPNIPSSESNSIATTTPSTVGAEISTQNQLPVDQISSGQPLPQPNSVTNQTPANSAGPPPQMSNNVPGPPTGPQGQLAPTSQQQAQLTPNNMPQTGVPQSSMGPNLMPPNTMTNNHMPGPNMHPNNMPPGPNSAYPMGPPGNMDPNFPQRMPMNRGMQPGMQQQPPYGPPNMSMDPNNPMGPMSGPMRPGQPGPIGMNDPRMRMPHGPMQAGPDGPRMPMPPQMGPQGMMQRPGMPPGPMNYPGPMRMPMQGGPGGPTPPQGPGMMPPGPPHHVQMEMQHISQQLNHLYNQPQNPQIQQQINDLQGRMNSLQQMAAHGPPPPNQWGPQGPPPPSSGPMMPPHPAPNMSDPNMQPQMMNEAHDEMQDAPLRRGKDSKKKPRPRPSRSGGGSRSRKKKEKEAFDMDDDGESSLDKPPENMVLDPSTGTMVPNAETPQPDTEGMENSPSFEAAMEPKSSRPKFKNKTPIKPKPNKTLLQFSKKKRKRSDSDDDYGDDYDPEEGRRRRRGRGPVEEEEDDMQDSPKVDDNKEKRRSARSRKATKYVDDTDYGFEDEGDNAVNIQIPNENSTDGKIVSEAASEVGAEGTPSATPSVAGGDPEASNASSAPGTTVPGTPAEGTLDASTNQSGPNYAFVDVTAEDTMIVQYILKARMGTRELEDDEVDPSSFEVPREVMNKYGRGPLPPRTQIEADIINLKSEKERRKSVNQSFDGTKENELKSPKPMKEEGNKEEADTAKTESNQKDEKDVETEENSADDKCDGVTEDEKKKDMAAKEDGKEDKTCDNDSIKKEDETNQDEKIDKEKEEVKEETKSDEEQKKTDSDVKPITEKEKVPEPIPENTSPARLIEVEEFYVKFKNFSYLHCQWLTEEELLRGDKRVGQKVRRFQQKQRGSSNCLDFCDDDAFNPDYIEVDRVLDTSSHTDPVTNITTKHYLVKWRSLPYEDCTWELETDVDPKKITDFEKWRVPPPADQIYKRRPRKSEWKKSDAPPTFLNNNVLRPYQLEGVNWLLFSWYHGNNCLLADEMGLGKTIQSLAFLDGMFKYGIRGPFLVIAPLSTIPNWQREFELWSEMNVIVYHGSQTSRNMLAEYEMYYKDDKGQKMTDVFKFHVLITTYESVISDIIELSEIKWRACVIDEAHRLKNAKCKLIEGLQLLTLETRLLLSGTPLQNNIQELFSLLSFLEPDQFRSQSEFMKEFGDMQNEEQVKKLQALLKPLMLRRMKEDVEKSLKPKEETIVEVELTNIQKKYYRGILEKNFSFLQKGTTNANLPNLMNTMMELRKCCIHPYLLNGAEEQIQNDYTTQKDSYEDYDELYFKALTHSSGKMVLLDKLLPKLKQNGHRVLIFSQMVKMLDLLEDYLIKRKYAFERIDGSIRGNLRQAAIDRYCRPDSDRFVFLLCTKAGGLGINLVAADTCIIYDSDWNPQNDLQAMARCHRIGQKQDVKIYRLVTRNTYEREMFDRASLKLGLDKAVLQSMNTSMSKTGNPSQSNSLSKKEVEDLLKKGAYGALMDDDNAGDKFVEEDIDQILERRTKVLTQDTSDQKGGSFSKASFASADTADIQIDDPEFWQKWAKKAEIEENEHKETLVVDEPRERKSVARFGGNESLNPNECSELDSSSGSDDEDGRRRGRSAGQDDGKKKKRGRRSRFDEDEDYMDDENNVEYGGWTRSELFRIEKAALLFGWGRWEEILANAGLRKGFNAQLAEDAFRMTLLYCVNSYKGDDKIKSFVWDLITPPQYSGNKVVKNHAGLSGPVPRGRKGKKLKNASAKEASESGISAPSGIDVGWVSHEKYDMQDNLDKGYRKHLDRHNNKILLRIRLLYYVQHEILGNVLDVVNKDEVPVSKVPLVIPATEVPPTSWWDANADKSLLIGTYRYGYEQFDLMRQDPHLSFLSKCGPPSSSEESAIMNKTLDGDDTKVLDEDEDSIMSSKTPSEKANSKKPDDNLDNSVASEDAKIKKSENEEADDEDSKKDKDKNGEVDDSTKVSPSKDSSKEKSSKTKDLESEKAAVNGSVSSDSEKSQLVPFPGPSDLNGRLRRLISSFQREKLKEMARQAAVDKRNERRERIEQVIKEREQQKLEMLQKRWNRREEIEFFRTLVAYGVNYDAKTEKFDWERFKQLSKLDKKFDETLTEYYLAFLDMCERLTGKKKSGKQENFSVTPEPIAEEKANKVLERLDMFKKLRQDIVKHQNLDERLLLALDNQDLPDWWIPGKHDRDLLMGVAKHGIIRMEFHILNDQELSFQDIMKRHLSGESMIDSKEKKLYEEMRANVAAARKEKVKDEKEDVKEDEETKKDTDVSESEKEAKEEKVDVEPKEEEKEGETDEKIKAEDSKEENIDDKKEEEKTDDQEPMETDEKSADKDEVEESKVESENKEDKEEENAEDKEDEALQKKKLKIKLKKGKKRGPGRPPKNSEKDNPFVEDDLDDMDFDDIDDEGFPVASKQSSEKPAKRKPGRPPGRPKKQLELVDESEGKRSTRSDLRVIPFDGSPSKSSVSLTPVKKSSDQETQKRKGGYVSVSIDPPQISLQQMEQMARGGVYDMDMMTDLMQQTYAAAIKWPKDRILTIRLEHIMEAVETDKWPVTKDFSYAEAAGLTIDEAPAAAEGVTSTPLRDATTPAMSEVSEVSNPYEDANVLTPGRKHGNRGRKPLGASHMDDKSSKIRSLLTAGRSEGEDIRFGDTLLHVPAGTHLSDDVAQPLLDLSRHGITITPINSTLVSTDNTSSLTSSLSILKQSRCRDPLSAVFGRDHDASYKRSFTLADLPSAALDLSNRGGGGIGGKSRNMGSVEITPVNGDASNSVDGNMSALEQARAMERHFNAMDMELAKAGLSKSLKVSPVNISSPTLLSPSAGRASSPTNAATHTPGSVSSVTPPASTTSPPPKAGSKLEAIFGGKRKLSDDTKADKSKKKKRLDDIMFGLGAAKGLSLDKEKAAAAAKGVSAGQSLLKKVTDQSKPGMELNNLQDLLGPPGSPADAKVQKWLADQMGVVPDRPTTPSTATSGGAAAAAGSPAAAGTATGSGSDAGRSPRSNSNPMEWMSNLSGDEHVTVFNRFTGKKLSGTQGPKLKYLAQWLIENPMFEVDPKWAEVVKSKEANARDQAASPQPKSSQKKGPGRPTLDGEPAKSSKDGGMGPSFSSMGLAGLGLDPKNPLAGLSSMDAKNPLSLAALYGIDPKKLDPVTAAMLGFGDPKNPMKMDPMMLQAMGLDAKTLQAMGIDPKILDTKASPSTSKQSGSTPLPGLDAKSLQSLGLDPKMLQSMGLDSKALQAMGIDAKTAQTLLGGDTKQSSSSLTPEQKFWQSMGLDPKAMQAMGLDAKSLQALGMDPKTLQSLGMDPKMLQSMGMDPKTLQAMGLDPKSSQAKATDTKSGSSSSDKAKDLKSSAESKTSTGIDEKMLAAMGLDSKALQAMGLDSKAIQALAMDPRALQAYGMDPKMLQAMGMDPKTLQAMGMDPKALQSMGMDPKLLQSMGLDPKTLQAMGMDPKLLQSMGLDPKALQSMGLDPKVLQSMGMDPKTLQAMGMDPKVLQSMGIDPKTMSSPALDQNMLKAMGMDAKALKAMGLDAKALQSMGIDNKTLQAMGMLSPDARSSSPSATPSTSKGDKERSSPSVKSSTSNSKDKLPSPMDIDPKKFDPAMLAALGMDPKTLKMDPVTLTALGLDPKNPNSSLMAAMAAMDPSIAAMYGVGLPSSSAMSAPTSDSSGKKTTPLENPSPKGQRSAPSPRTSRSSPSPRPPSRASVKSDEHRKSPRTSIPSSSTPSTSLSTSTSALLSGMGIDPKIFAGMDPKLLQAAGLDPKMLSSLDTKSMGGLDPRQFGLDPKSLAGMDPKLLQAAGIDPKLINSMDPKLFGGLDPKLLAGMDPKLLAGMDPKLLTGMDPKLLAGFDPKLLGSIDPKLLGGIDPKLLSGMDPKFLSMMDPKLLAGIDPKLLFGGADTKKSTSESKTSSSSETKLSSPGAGKASSSSAIKTSSSGGLDPRLLGLDPKMLQGLDENALKSLGLDPKIVANLLDPKASSADEQSSSTAKNMAKMTTASTTTFSNLDVRPSTSTLANSKDKSDAKTSSKKEDKPAGIDPKIAAAYGLDPKLLAGIDPKLLAGMDPQMLFGMDPKLLASMDPKLLAGMDPRLLAGMDPKMLGMDPKSMMGLDPKLLGLDPKALASLDPKILAAYGLDPKSLDSKSMSKSEQSLLASMGLDPKMLAGMDPKVLASMGLDPKSLAALDPRMLASMGLDPKAMSGVDSKQLASMGMDPKALAGLDAKTLASFGLDPKMLASMDPKLLASMGLDPKLLSSLNDPKASSSKSSKGQDPKSSSSTDGKKPGGSSGADPKTNSAFDPKSFGLDPKMFAGMDPKMLQQMGLDPKMLASMDPKMLASLSDPKLLAGMDPKTLAALSDPKALASMDPKVLSSLMDPKMLASMDPKMLASFSDPKMLASLGLDPKMFGSLDPKLMASMGLDPKLMGLDPKMMAGMDPKLMAGLDPKMLAGMDPKMLQGIDPSIAAMYGLAMPSTASSSSSNGIGTPSSSKGATSGNSTKAKPGTVAAALEEKKKSKGQNSSMTYDNDHSDDKPVDEPTSNKKSTDEDMTDRTEDETGEDNDHDGEKDKGEARKGLTSEERVLLREKKRQRLAKEQETVESKTSSSHEKTAHPNPFDDDDDVDEEEAGGNEVNHTNNIEEGGGGNDDSRPNSADSEGEENKERKKGGKGRKRKSEDQERAQSPPPTGRSTRDSTKRCTRASRNAS